MLVFSPPPTHTHTNTPQCSQEVCLLSDQPQKQLSLHRSSAWQPLQGASCILCLQVVLPSHCEVLGLWREEISSWVSCPSVNWSVCMSVCMSICLHCLSLCLCILHCLCPFVHLSVFRLSICVSVCPLICQFVYLLLCLVHTPPSLGMRMAFTAPLQSE